MCRLLSVPRPLPRLRNLPPPAGEKVLPAHLRPFLRTPERGAGRPREPSRRRDRAQGAPRCEEEPQTSGNAFSGAGAHQDQERAGREGQQLQHAECAGRVQGRQFLRTRDPVRASPPQNSGAAVDPVGQRICLGGRVGAFPLQPPPRTAQRRAFRLHVAEPEQPVPVLRRGHHDEAQPLEHGRDTHDPDAPSENGIRRPEFPQVGQQFGRGQREGVFRERNQAFRPAGQLPAAAGDDQYQNMDAAQRDRAHAGRHGLHRGGAQTGRDLRRAARIHQTEYPDGCGRTAQRAGTGVPARSL